MPRRRRAEPDDSSSNHHAPPPAVAEAMLDAIGLVAPGLVGSADVAENKGRDAAPGNVHRLRLTPVWTIEDAETRRLCARAVLEARCGRLWFARRPVTLKGSRPCWLETVVLGEDGAPLDRSDAFRLPWREARQRMHAATLTDIATQAPVRCLWRGLPDLPKTLKHTRAGEILAEIERQPGQWQSAEQLAPPGSAVLGELDAQLADQRVLGGNLGRAVAMSTIATARAVSKD